MRRLLPARQPQQGLPLGSDAVVVLAGEDARSQVPAGCRDVPVRPAVAAGSSGGGTPGQLPGARRRVRDKAQALQWWLGDPWLPNQQFEYGVLADRADIGPALACDRSDELPARRWEEAADALAFQAATQGSGRTALARLPSGEPIRLTVIEHDVPNFPDRQVQLADGFVNLPGSWMTADQPQGRFESEPRGEQPVHHEVVHALGDAVAVLHQDQSRLRLVARPTGRGITRRPYARLV